MNMDTLQQTHNKSDSKERQLYGIIVWFDISDPLR